MEFDNSGPVMHIKLLLGASFDGGPFVFLKIVLIKVDFLQFFFYHSIVFRPVISLSPELSWKPMRPLRFWVPTSWM